MALNNMLYTYPQSWDDKNMDWENPDPRNYDYIVSLLLALRERISVSFITSYSSSVSLSYNIPTRLLVAPPYSLFSNNNHSSSSLGNYIQYEVIADTIKNLCKHFINWEKTSDVNRADIPENAVSSSGNASRSYTTSFNCNIFWTWSDLCRELPDLCLIPTSSSLQIDHMNFIRACKNAIDKLTICTVCTKRTDSGTGPYINIVSKSNKGSGYSSSKDEDKKQSATDRVIDNLNSNNNYTESNRTIYGAFHLYTFPSNTFMVIDKSSIGGWYSSSNYSSYCCCEMVDLKKIILFPLPDKKARLKFVVLATNPSIKAAYSNASLPGTVTYQFSNSGLPFEKGLNVITSEELTTSKVLSQSFGDDVYTPPDVLYPTEENAWIVNGCQVTLFPYIDYGVNGGFNFFSPSI